MIVAIPTQPGRPAALMSLPATSLPTPLQPDTAAALARFADGLDSNALLWASGYLAGMARALVPAATVAVEVILV